MVGHVGHYNIVVPIHCHSPGAVELRGVAFSISIARYASPRQCGHQALRRDPANAMVVKVRNINVALPIHRHSAGVSELSGGARSVSMAPLAGARQCGHHALR
eukprot:8769520-Pyramimonas_sp.AAC.2